MPVAMVPPPRGGLAFEMVVEFGVENTLGKRLLQLVEKPVLVENLFRVTAVQKLVQGVFLDRHKRPPSASLWALHTRFLTVPPVDAARTEEMAVRRIGQRLYAARLAATCR